MPAAQEKEAPGASSALVEAKLSWAGSKLQALAADKLNGLGCVGGNRNGAGGIFFEFLFGLSRFVDLLLVESVFEILNT